MTSAEHKNSKEVPKKLFVPVTAKDIEEVLRYHEKNNNNKSFFEILWFKIGSYVKLKDKAEIGEIVSFGKIENKRGIKYIVKINFLEGEKTIDFFSVSYKNLFNSTESKHQELKKILSNVNLVLIDKEEAEMIMELQEAIRDMEDDDLLDFVECGEIEETDLPYIREFLIEESNRRNKNNRR